MTATSNDRVAAGGAAVTDEAPAIRAQQPRPDVSTPWTRGRAANAPKRRAVLAEAGGWVLVGLMNVASVASQTPERTWGGRLLHHAVDLAHFALLGCIAALLVVLDKALLVRLRVPRAVRVVLALLLFTLLGRFLLTADLANLLLRFEPPAKLPVHELVAFLLAAGYLVWRDRTRALSRALPAWAMAALFVGLVLATALLLPTDYPGSQLFAAALSARVGTLLLLDRRRMQLASSGQLALAFGAVTLMLVPALFARPGGRVWRSVLRVPTAVAAPFLSRALASKDSVASAWIHSKYPQWLRPRVNLPEKPARGPRPLAGNPLVILFTIDSLRADVLASGKYDDSLPTLAKLRDESYYFTLARSAASSTVPSFASIFSGKLYSELDWSHSRVLPIDDRTERWPARLSENGVVTINAPCLKVLRGNAGIATGFTIERQTSRDWANSWSTTKLLLPELEKLGDRPGFAFAHMLDAHSPHTMGKKTGTLFERYVSEIALVDTTLGKLRAFLEKQGLSQRTILIISADHGEGFLEHGAGQHGRTTYEELVRVPLIIHVPGATPKRIDAPVTLMDLGPTILDIFGLPAPGHIRGQTLLPVMAGKPFEPIWPIAAESTRRVQSLIYPDGIKAARDVTNGTLEVYDLKSDPGEQNDLNGSPDFPHARYSAGVIEFFETHTFRKPGYEVPWRKF